MRRQTPRLLCQNLPELHEQQSAADQDACGPEYRPDFLAQRERLGRIAPMFHPVGIAERCAALASGTLAQLNLIFSRGVPPLASFSAAQSLVPRGRIIGPFGRCSIS